MSYSYYPHSSAFGGWGVPFAQMKVKKTTSVHVTRYPNGVDCSALSDDGKMILDFFMSITKDQGWHEISKTFWESMMDKSRYKKELNKLIDAKIIECDDSYLQASKAKDGKGFCKSYRLSPILIDKVLNGEFSVEVQQVKYVSPSRNLGYRVEFESGLGTYSQYEIELIKESYGNFNLHHKWAHGTFFKSDFRELVILDKIFHGGVLKISEGMKVGRIYSRIHYLPKRLRHLLQIGGKNVKMYDASSCLPAIMVSFIKAFPSEQEKYLKLVYGTGLYEKIIEISECDGFDREDAKVAIQQWMSNGRYERLWSVDVVKKIDEFIKGEFPNLYEVKKRNEGTLQAKLQNIEADLFVKMNCDVASIHDSFFIACGDRSQDFRRRFCNLSEKELGFPLVLNKVDLKEESKKALINKIKSAKPQIQEMLFDAFKLI